MRGLAQTFALRRDQRDLARLADPSLLQQFFDDACGDRQEAGRQTLAFGFDPVPVDLRQERSAVIADGVGEGLDPSAFTIASVPARVAARGDLAAGLHTTRQSLSKALARL